ncbi:MULTISPECIES: stage III sporulation protein AG [Cohnella]|jgi:stage III sporulation protein AG|uniref:stage III sporulation protein AG n=1 Tax=Cohnella TaxID=329857 RepID=UPI0003604F6D|nr:MULTISPECIES: stage III sporulation protein AG [Cohnella]REK66023.1 MAG: stage III sporulation protein AG [Cohnella sp.]
MAKWLQQLESFIGGGPGGPRRIKAFRWLVLIGLIGAALILIASFLNIKPVDPARDQDYRPLGDSDMQEQQALPAGGARSDDPFAEIESTLENRLKELLENMVGVGTVDVMVTVDSTEETVVQQNERETSAITDETDRNGAKRHITDISRDGQVVLYEVSGNQTPIVVKKIKPKIRGVLIVAKGGENATVHKLIAEAVSKGLDVPIHRISVVPRKQ